MAYKLYVNNKLAVFNGYDKGTITLFGTVYEWDNSDGEIPDNVLISSDHLYLKTKDGEFLTFTPKTDN